MRPSRTVIEQRTRDYVVTYVDSRGRAQVRTWSTHEMAAQYAALMVGAGSTEVAIDGREVRGV